MSTNQHTANRRQYRLSLTQRKAIDLLLSGKNDREVAEQLGVGRSTVARWRLQDPKFQLALDRRRAEVWPTANDFIPSLLPTALASMSEQLRVGPNRGRLALDFVFRAGLLGKPYSGALGIVGTASEESAATTDSADTIEQSPDKTAAPDTSQSNDGTQSHNVTQDHADSRDSAA